MKLIPVILSGGAGTRLWPLSRKQYPKQYLSLAEEKTMLQATVLRLNGIKGLGDPIIICNNEHRFLVAEQLQQISIQNPTILLEPIGRNTAPAITAAAFQVKKSNQNEDVILLVLSADHVIEDITAFHKAIDVATTQAESRKLVTFGVIPTVAHSGYGYIKAINNNIEQDVYNVETFIEKPDLVTAAEYLEEGNYFWNSGMFMFQVDTLIQELRLHSGEIVRTVEKSVQNATKDLDFVRLEMSAFEASDNESIDYALMEKTNKAVVIPLDVGWSDVGSWATLHEIGRQDDYGNVISGDVYTDECINCYINADHHMVAVIGLENVIVVDTSDATLVASKSKAQEVKKVVKKLKQQKRYEELLHRKVYRPWGWYDTIDRGTNFQVKRINVKAGASLSLQKHNYRAEHWIIVKGVAKVTRNEETFLLNENESTYIPIGTIHRLENPENIVLEMIEVQSGKYLGEDDIERLDDQYGRV